MMSQEAAEALEYRQHFFLKSGARVVSDFIEVENDPYHKTVRQVAEDLARWARGVEDGMFMFPVNESLTYVPFRSVEYATLEYITDRRDTSVFATPDTDYVFGGE